MELRSSDCDEFFLVGKYKDVNEVYVANLVDVNIYTTPDDFIIIRDIYSRPARHYVNGQLGIIRRLDIQNKDVITDEDIVSILDRL